MGLSPTPTLGMCDSDIGMNPATAGSALTQRTICERPLPTSTNCSIRDRAVTSRAVATLSLPDTMGHGRVAAHRNARARLRALPLDASSGHTGVAAAPIGDRACCLRALRG
jgi:hypothetical protein